MSWMTFRIVPGLEREAVVAALFEVGAQAVQEDGAAIVTSFPPEVDVARVRAAVRAADATASIGASTMPDVNWSEAWRDQITSHDVGALVITPPWLAHGMDPAHTVIIDPGMAFGTGDHPTTRGVLRLMPHFITPGITVADLGAGSAALAIAAIKLGASRAAAIELDVDAIGNAESNVEANGVVGRVQVIQGDATTLLPLVAPVGLIFANIISSVLIPLLPVMAAALPAGAHAILSGLLVEEQPQLRAHFAAGGWQEVSDDVEGSWWSVALRRP